MKLTERVLKTIRNYDMIKPGDSVLAAVSGGPDSVLLLLSLVALKNKLKLKEISVCNLDHGLRGKDSRDDSSFVKKTAEGLGLRFFHKQVRIDADKPGKLSTEERAREERYRFFGDAASASGANVIATGHTLDDQAETIVMRFVTGASMKGMTGIAPVRDHAGVRVIRPLVELEKKEIVRYLEDNAVSYRIDGTNAKPLYFRNVVRNEIIPFLEKYNPRLKRVLFNLAEHLRDDFEFIASAKRTASGAMFAQGPGRGSRVALKDIAVQPKAIQKEVLRDLLESSGGEVKRLSFRHWKQMEDLLTRKGKGHAVDLPGSIRVTRTDRHLVFDSI